MSVVTLSPEPDPAHVRSLIRACIRGLQSVWTLANELDKLAQKESPSHTMDIIMEEAVDYDDFLGVTDAQVDRIFKCIVNDTTSPEPDPLAHLAQERLVAMIAPHALLIQRAIASLTADLSREVGVEVPFHEVMNLLILRVGMEHAAQSLQE